MGRIEVVGMPPDPHKGVMQGIFGDLAAADNSQGHPKKAGRRGPVKFLEGHAILATGPEKQLLQSVVGLVSGRSRRNIRILHLSKT